MEYLQYSSITKDYGIYTTSFKPCYKWNTFNTIKYTLKNGDTQVVLNLVINGIPSILIYQALYQSHLYRSFKPCYKWNTFNTKGTNGEILKGKFEF